ncbi:MAG: S8 family serine peptidase [Meiothermus sp.]|nr:S8 family serine peptidase [Meiothermus sp.]
MNTGQLRITLQRGLALALVALVAACGSTPPQATSPGGSGYLLTVRLEPADTQETVAQRYGGEVIAWLDGQAILRMGEEAVAQLQARGVSMQNTTLEANADVGTPATMSGWNAWGSGWNAWGSGWNAWGSGWNAWSGGATSAVPALPSGNRSAFMQVKLPQAQALARNYGAGIKVAVIDTGLDTAHPMFQGRLAPAAEWRDFVDGDNNPAEVAGNGFGHGTAVAGLILQAAPRATILPIRVLGPNGSGSVANVVSAIDWARQRGAQVINLSLGTDVDVAALRTQISHVNGLGVFVVAAAGNSGGSLKFPAAAAQNAPNSDRLWSVGSVNSSGNRSSFSSFGSALKFMAPGEGIQSAFPGNQVATVRGTSFAAPLVSGMLALAMGETSSANWGSLQAWLANSTFGAGTTGSLFGVINAASFLQKLPGVPRKSALFVVGSTTLSSGDSAVRDRLEDIGYSVTVKNHNDAQIGDSLDKHLMLISSSASSSIVNTEFLNTTAPVVTWEHAIFHHMKMTDSPTTNYGSASSLTQLRMNSSTSTHPLAAGLTGDHAVYSANNNMTWGRPTAGAVRVATLTADTTRATIFGYDRGSTMMGMTAPNRRVGLFMNHVGAEMTPAGWNLFEAAVTWAVSGN